MMHFRFKTIFLLSILLSLLFGTYSLAEDSSVNPVSILDVVKGTVLLKIKNSELLNNDLKQILTGRDEPKKNKLIRVEGTNDGNEIKLQGTGQNGEGYEFTLSTSSGNCGVSPIIPGKVIKETIPFPYPFSIGFDSLSTEIEPDINTNDKYKCRGANGKATLKANFQETENGSPIVSGKVNLQFRGSVGLPGMVSEECAPFPSPDASPNNDSDEKYIEEPEVINVKLENVSSIDLPFLLNVTVKVEVTNPDVISLESTTSTPDYVAGTVNGFTETGAVDPKSAIVTIVSKKTTSLLGVPTLAGLPSCITFNLRPLGSMAGSSEVIVKEVLVGDKLLTGVKITQSEETVQVTCKDPNDCD